MLLVKYAFLTSQNKNVAKGQKPIREQHRETKSGPLADMRGKSIMLPRNPQGPQSGELVINSCFVWTPVVCGPILWFCGNSCSPVLVHRHTRTEATKTSTPPSCSVVPVMREETQLSSSKLLIEGYSVVGISPLEDQVAPFLVPEHKDFPSAPSKQQGVSSLPMLPRAGGHWGMHFTRGVHTIFSPLKITV